MALKDLSCSNDPHLRAAFARLVKDFQPAVIVETGTFAGHTTAYLATLGPRVHSIELSIERAQAATAALADESLGERVVVHQGNSPAVLDELLKELPRPALFFLDAHWNDYWPLLDELRTLTLHRRDDAILVIHDCQVPDQNFGFDTYRGQPLNLDYVRDALSGLYGANGFVATYNTEAGGARRGVLYLVPKQTRQVSGTRVHEDY